MAGLAIMATLVISYLRTLVYNPHKSTGKLFWCIWRACYQAESVFPQKQVVWKCEMPAEFFSFLGGKKKKILPVFYTG
jgi:hypothetical protein